jgi:hypothetical protein
VEPADLEPARRGQPLEHVAVGRELVVGRDDRAPAGTRVERRRGELVQVDRRRVADDRLARLGADDPGPDDLADPGRLVEPVVPAADELAAPLLADPAREAVGRGPREPPERVPVEVDERRVVLDEVGPEAGQRVGRVERPGLLLERGGGRAQRSSLLVVLPVSTLLPGGRDRTTC